MKKIFMLACLAFFMGACSAGFKPLGWDTMPDGSKLGAYQVKNSGVSGTDVTALETWRCPKGAECGKVGAYSGSSPGAVEVGVAGIGQATVNAVGAGVSAHFLSQTKPTRINESTSLTGVSGGVHANAEAEGGNVIGSGNSTNTNSNKNIAKGGAGGQGGSATIKDSGNSKISDSGNSSSSSKTGPINNTAKTGPIDNSSSSSAKTGPITNNNSAKTGEIEVNPVVNNKPVTTVTVQQPPPSAPCSWCGDGKDGKDNNGGKKDD